MTKTWFTSDTHFNHSNIIKYCDRPFASVEEMDEEMIARWNQCVKPGDTVYHLGDFYLSRKNNLISSYIYRLNGRIILIKGNHDTSEELNGLFQEAHTYLEIRVCGVRTVLSHFPFLRWHHCYKGSWHLHGHCHGSLDNTEVKRLDVGVDTHEFRPYSEEQIKEHMDKPV